MKASLGIRLYYIWVMVVHPGIRFGTINKDQEAMSHDAVLRCCVLRELYSSQCPEKVFFLFLSVMCEFENIMTSL